jgi:hypothetical protein
MSQTLLSVQALISAGDFLVSTHADHELQNDAISLREMIDGVQSAIVVEDYPTFAKGPCVLVLQHDAASQPVHLLWGLRSGTARPAVLITAYRPDSTRWTDSFLRRRS